MSKNNRKTRRQQIKQSGQQQPSPQLLPLSSAIGPHPAGGSVTKITFWRTARENWEGIAAIAALLIASLSAVFSYQQATHAAVQAQEAKKQTDLSNRLYERQTGRVRAELTASDFTPKSAPKEYLRRLPGLADNSEPCFVVDSVDELMQAPFTVTMKNFGDEPVDAVRVEVRSVWDRRTDQAVQGRVYFNPNDVGLKQVSHAEYVLTKKLEKGETVSVNITRLILEQMIEVQPPVYPGDMAYALFEVSTFGRLVGSTTFDTASDMKYIRIPTLYWKISGFDKERCRKIIAEKQESPVINYDEQKVIAEYRRRWKTK